MSFGKKKEETGELELAKKEQKTVGEKKKSMSVSFDLGEKLKKFGLSKIVIILCIGMIILIFLSDLLDGFGSSGSKDASSETGSSSNQNNKNFGPTDEYIKSSENRLKQVLMKVEGIGHVEVMITVKSSKESVILKDQDQEDAKTEEEDSAGGSRKNSSTKKKDQTVFQQSEQGVSSPYAVKELEPQIEGILVVADGGNNEVVKSEVVAAVQVLFEVPAHKIKVMSMSQSKKK